MSATHLRSFHAAAIEGSFTAAAQSLNVSQPTVTTQVKELETRYGVELFHRRGRGVELTESGRTLLAITQRLSANQKEAIEFLTAAGGLKTGHLRIGAVGPYQVAEILAAFHREYSGIQVSVKFGNSKLIEDGVLQYETDIAVLGLHSAHPQLFSMDYSEPEVLIVVPKDHPWSMRKTIRIEEMNDQPMVRREPGSETRHAIESALAAAGVTPRYVMEIGSREGVFAACAQGIGVGAVSEEEYVPNELLRALRIANAKILMKVHLVCLAERRDGRLIEPFLAVAEKLARGRRRRKRSAGARG